MPIAPPGGSDNCQYSVLPIVSSIYTPATTGTWTTINPASFVQDWTRPRRVARTSTVATTRIGLELGSTTVGAGSAQNVEAFVIENTNFNDIFIQGSNDGTNWVWSEVFVCTESDPDDGRRKMLCIPSTTFNYRYLRFGPNNAVSGATSYYVGIFSMWGRLDALDKNFSTPYEKTLLDDAPTVQFENGGLEVGLSSPVRIQFALQARIERTNGVALDQYKAMALYPRDKTMLLFENMGDLTQVYHLRRTNSFRITRTENATVTVSGIQFLEVA